MAILHFGFQPEPRSSFIPYAHERDLVVYTGTHDNNTTVGWYLEDAGDDEADLVVGDGEVGPGCVEVDGAVVEGRPGTWMHLPASTPHSVVAKTPLILLLHLLKHAG